MKVKNRMPVLQRINTKAVNERQSLVMNRMLEHDWEGHLNTTKYARLAKCSQDTALRDTKELLDRGILVKYQSGGRSTSYRLADPNTM